jgi:Uma2 family endonuclease
MGNATLATKQSVENAYDLVEPRFERIGTTEYAMSSPGYKHQNVLLGIGAQLREKLQASGCMTIVAPFDVYPLYDKGDEYTLVQPDIFLAGPLDRCDRSKLQDKRYNGAPKFIIEILSSNRSHDMITKLYLYEKAGVAEYWIIDPEEQIITALELLDGKYRHRGYSGEDEVPLASIPGCTVEFKKVFEHISQEQSS